MNRITEGIIINPDRHPLSTAPNAVKQFDSIHPSRRHRLLQRVHNQLVHTSPCALGRFAEPLVEIFGNIFHSDIHNGTDMAPFRDGASLTLSNVHDHIARLSFRGFC